MKTQAEYMAESRKRREDAGLVPLRISEFWVTQQQRDYLKSEINKFIKSYISQ